MYAATVLLAIMGAVGACVYGGIMRYLRERRAKQLPSWALTDYPLQHTAAENNEIDHWQGAPLGVVRDGASKCEYGALYVLGMIFSETKRKGSERESDIELARTLFVNAAMLGFPPAIYEIRKMYLEDRKLPWLTVVYLKLLIMCGHTEYEEVYDRTVAYCIQMDWIETVEIVEEMAAEKYELILSTRVGLVEAVDKNDYFNRMPTLIDDDVDMHDELMEQEIHFPDMSELW